MNSKEDTSATNRKDDGIKKKYRQLWVINFYSSLEKLSSDQIENLSEEEKKEYYNEWKTLVQNENTEQRDQRLLNIRNFPKKKFLLLPHWIMDRLKEAADQYVKGQWLSSILLCGAIVEFLRDDFFHAYRQKIPKGEHSSKRGVKRDLEKLLNWRILEKGDYDRLHKTRELRDKHTHMHRLGADAKSLKSDNFTALNNLFEFFTYENISQKYMPYLRYVDQYSKGP